VPIVTAGPADRAASAVPAPATVSPPAAATMRLSFQIMALRIVALLLFPWTPVEPPEK
jgi:hypothetical protein